MNKNKLLNQAEYIDIILSLLKSPYNIKSISKLIFISFCVKHEDNIKAYTNRKKDFVDIFFEKISLKLTTHEEEIIDIITAIDILNKNSKVKITGDNIIVDSDINFITENLFLNRIKDKVPNPIIEINKLDTKALLEEVIRFV